MIAPFELRSTPGGANLNYTFGMPFVEGDVPNGQVVQLGGVPTQCSILNRWDDGSAKFAVMTVTTTLAANSYASLAAALISPPGGTALTEANLLTAMTGKSFNVQLGSFGSKNLASLIGTAALFDNAVSGPRMSEFRYVSAVDADLTLIFDVRVYANGDVWVNWISQNGNMTSGPNKVYDLTVTRNGTAVVTAGVDQKHHTRVSGEAWLSTDYQIVPKHNSAYLMASKLFQNYYTGSAPSNTAMEAFNTAYTPMGRANLRATFGGTGADDQLAIVPRWDAHYVISGDARVFKGVVSNARAGGSYSIHFMDGATKKPWAFSSQPNWWATEVGGTAGGEAWSADHAHAPCIGYTAYLLTGNRQFREENQYWATWHAGSMNYVTREGIKMIMLGQARQHAWTLRTLATACVITPDGDNLQTEFANAWRSNMDTRDKVYVKGTIADNMTGGLSNGPNNLGVMHFLSYDNLGDPYTPGDGIWSDAPWMQNFFTSVMGFSWNMQVPQQSTADRASHKAVRDHCYKHVVGLLGVGNALGRPYPYGAAYTADYATTTIPNESQQKITYYPSWTEQWAQQKIRDSLSDPAVSLGSPLLGPSAGSPSEFSTGYWGNLHPAAAYAAEHGIVGSKDAWTRYSSASNYANLITGFGEVPHYGVMPRSVADVGGEEPEETVTPTFSYVGTALGVIYGGKTSGTPPPPPPPPEGMPAWRPPAIGDGTARFADVPMLNTLSSVAPSIYTTSAVNTAFSHYSGSAILHDVGAYGTQAYHGAGHYTAPDSIDIQMTLLCNYETLLWSVVNVPVAPNPSDTAIPPFIYPDGTHSNPHTYSGLQEYPAAWAGSAGGHYMAQMCYAGSGPTAKNVVSLFNTAMVNNGYSIMLTNQAGHPTEPNVLSFSAGSGASAASYPITGIDYTKKGWWAACKAERDYTLFISAETGEVTQYPAGALGNGQSNALVVAESLDLIIELDGGYSEGSAASTSYRRMTFRNRTTGVLTTSQSLGYVPARSQGYGGPSDVFHSPGNIGLQWVEELGAIYGMDDAVNPPKIYKIVPPSSNITTNPWTWVEVSASHWDADVGGQTQLQASENLVWSKFRWNKKLQAFTYCTEYTRKPQIITII